MNCTECDITPESGITFVRPSKSNVPLCDHCYALKRGGIKQPKTFRIAAEHTRALNVLRSNSRKGRRSRDVIEELDKAIGSAESCCKQLDSVVHTRIAGPNRRKISPSIMEWLGRSWSKLSQAILLARAYRDSVEIASYIKRRAEADAWISQEDVRIRVFGRDGWRCLHCGHTENLSVDHIKPVRKWGSNEDDNLQTLCLPCNLKKGNK